MTLREQQSEFVRMAVRLIEYAHAQGYELTFGDAFRDTRCPYGAKDTMHLKRLAIDLNLFKDGRYLDETEDHLPLGEYWESIGGRWGGRYKIRDGNHYEYKQD